MGAAVVGRDDFEIQVPMVPVEVVFDAEIGKMHPVVEVRQVMLSRPGFNLARVPIGPAVTIRPIPIALLQELLVLALERTLGDHVPDVRVAVAELADGLPIGVVDARVVGQLATGNAVTVPVSAVFVAVAAVKVQELAAAVREHDAAVAFVERDGRHKAFVAQVVEAVGPRIERVVAQVSFGDDAERADRRQIAAVFAVQVVGLIVIPDGFALASARQIEAIKEHVPRVVGVPIARLPAVGALNLSFVVIVRFTSVRFTARGPFIMLAAVSGVVLSRIVAPPRIRAAKHTPSFRSSAA
jgi:hypothetical protein